MLRWTGSPRQGRVIQGHQQSASGPNFYQHQGHQHIWSEWTFRCFPVLQLPALLKEITIVRGIDQWCSQISGGNHLMYQLPCNLKFGIRSVPQPKQSWYVLHKTGGKRKAYAQTQQIHIAVMYQGMATKEIMLLPTWWGQGVHHPASEKHLMSRYVFQRTHSFISFIQFFCGNHPPNTFTQQG
jgi:hypothetical protein